MNYGQSPALCPDPRSGRGRALTAYAVANFCRSRVAIASILVLVAGQASAQSFWLPCLLPIVAMAPLVFHPHPVKRRGARRRTPHSFHLVTEGAMCAVSLGEGLTYGNLDDDFDHAFGGGESYFGGGGDFGGDEGGGFGGFPGGGGFGQGSDVGPLFLVESPPLVISPPDIPTPPPSPVPETSTWAMLLAGLSAIGFLKWRRA